MADDMDRAQERDQNDRDAAIKAALAKIEATFAPRNVAVDGICIDCDEDIEPERLAVIRTARCADCARQHEQRTRHWNR